MTTPPLDHYPTLLRHARSLVPAHAADDLVQEVYLRLARREPDEVNSAYLHTALRQVWVSGWRHDQVVPSTPVGEFFEDWVPTAPDPADAVVATAHVEWLLSLVSETDAEILRLRIVEDESPRAVSEKLGIPYLSVGRRLSEAKRRLRLAVSAEKFTGVAA